MGDRQNKCTPLDTKEGYAFTFGPVRWLPYKPNSQQVKRGKKGRWQAMNDYAGWENCEAPSHVFETADLGIELLEARATIESQAARIAELEAALEPFSKEAVWWFENNYSAGEAPVEDFGTYESVMTVGDLFNARAALASKVT